MQLLQSAFRTFKLSYFCYASSLSHLNDQGKAVMVDVSSKSPSVRSAIASCEINLGMETFSMLKKNLIEKGDVLTVAKVAGIMAAKNTSQLIPLCHNINLNCVDIEFDLMEKDASVRIMSRVSCNSRTGVEMESLIAVTVAALTIYDMCKSVSLCIRISDIFLLSKRGGKRNFDISSSHFPGNQE